MGKKKEPFERLKLARQHARFDSAIDAARAFGWNENTYKSHENGKRGLKSVVESYAKAYRVSAGWLMTGENPPGWLKNNGATEPVPVFRSVPLLSPKEAASMSDALTGQALQTRGFTTIDAGPDIGPKVFGMVLGDNSMVANPATGDSSFPRGDVVVFDPDKPIKPGDFVCAVLDGDSEAIFRKYRPSAHRQRSDYDLVPLNSDYRTEHIDKKNQATLKGRLIRHIRKY